ncbi:MAG: YceI family protein [Alphaproteobacteria bacterium]|nr:YceI family protein [Alphaproteobacteria bacterium]
MKKLIALATVAILSFASTQAQAAVEEYDFDKKHTQVFFKVSHLGFSISHGRFNEVDGGFSFDLDHPEKSSVNVTIKTDSLDMGQDGWDEHLKGEDFFKVEAFPEMTFKSTAVEVTGEKTAKVTGDLTLLGVTKPVTLDVTYNKAGIHPFGGKYVAGFSATGMLKRSDFGMTYGLPNIGDDVHMMIEVEGFRKGDEADAEKAE